MSAVSVSVDGLAATHDRLRGVKGSYRSALGAMKAMRDRKMRVSCNTQINRLSAPELVLIYEDIQRAGGAECRDVGEGGRGKRR